jgi:hypothetical protein
MPVLRAKDFPKKDRMNGPPKHTEPTVDPTLAAWRKRKFKDLNAQEKDDLLRYMAEFMVFLAKDEP